MVEFFQNLKECIENTISDIKKYLFKTRDEVFEEAQKTVVFAYFLSTVLWTVKQNESLKTKAKHIYNTNDIVKKVVDITIYSVKNVFAALNNQRIEPFKSNWICTSILLKKNPDMFIGNTYSYMDLYDFIKEPIEENCNIGFVDGCETLNSMVSNTSNIEEGMVTMKIGEQYVNYVCPKPTDKSVVLELPLVACNFTFLSIQYTHPLMEDTIYIDLDKKYYYNKNEILSPLFIKRCLEHQPRNYHFDMDYVIHIIDNDIETFTLSSGQYILLNEKKYSIVNTKRV
jgi:hypothetical protein